ncbi:ABC transporter substrate-binding protein [Sesbania bispinosa]|nr:ABC transporter substrate-binding protein [Sesbania bispinosa]
MTVRKIKPTGGGGKKKKHNREKGKPLYLTLFLTASHRATTVVVALFHPLRPSLSHDSLPSLRPGVADRQATTVA